jgi:hypothetical protein
MADDQQQEWPNRRTEILLSTILIGIFSTMMLIWRTVYAVMNKRKLLVCDYLLILAGVSLLRKFVSISELMKDTVIQCHIHGIALHHNCCSTGPPH